MKAPHLALSCLRFSSFILCFFFINLLQAQEAFSITVLDEENRPLTGVEVYTSDFSFGSVTDINGAVNVEERFVDDELNFSYLGYEDQTVMGRLIINRGGIVVLQPQSEIIEEIVLLGRNELDPESLPYNVESIGAEEISSTNPQTSADALAQSGNVYIQKSQMGGGSPVIRGFEANKVLLVVDGVRMNNAIYRNGHLQNAITVDQAMLDEMQVIFGPNALIYGSDALGGVVHFKSRLPKLNFNKNRKFNSETNYYARYSSANNERSGHLDFNIGTEKFASLTSLTYSNFGDLRMGANRTTEFPDFGKRLRFVETVSGEDFERINEDFNVQVGTAYAQFDALQKFLYQANENLQIVYNFQYSTSTDVPRYDLLTEADGDNLRWAEWNYGPQNRLFSSLSFKYTQPTKLYDKAIFILSHQKIEEDRITRRFGRTARESQEEDVNVWNATLDFHKGNPSDKHKLYYGFDYNYNKVGSVAFSEDILNGEVSSDIFTRYPGEGSSMSALGVYAQYHLSDQSQMRHLNVGLRYTANMLDFRYSESDLITWPTQLTDGVTSNNDALIGSIGYVHNTTSGWQFNTLVSTAFRTPNIDDMAKIRVRIDEITFPNPDLTPERSLNGELTLAKSFKDSRGKENAKLSLTYFATSISDAIIRQPFMQANGSPIFVDGIDTFNIVANINASQAFVQGISANLHLQPTNNINIKSSVNWTKGQVSAPSERPLSHIPPLYGKFEVAYEQEKWNLKYVSRYNASKPLELYGDSSDNPEFATPEGALAWHTLNLYGSYSLTKKLELSVGLENLLDTHYRQFASGVSAAGRNAIITLRGKL